MKKLNKSMIRKLTFHSLVILFLFTHTNAQAQGGGEGGGIDKLIAYLNALADTTVKTVSELIYEVIPSTAKTITEQNLQLSATKEVHRQTEKGAG